jgi:hypothetical protein
MTYHPTLARGHKYIVVAFYYFTKWAKSMPMFSNDGKMMSLFIFNQVIVIFGVPKEIFIDHGSHFQNKMFYKLETKLGFH